MEMTRKNIKEYVAWVKSQMEAEDFPSWAKFIGVPKSKMDLIDWMDEANIPYWKQDVGDAYRVLLK